MGIAEFFDDLAENDMIRQELYEAFSKEFEIMAYNEINKTESDHLLFILLNIPLNAHNGKSLVQLALEQRRVNFLNNDRVANVIHHMYREDELGPEDKVFIDDLDYSEMLSNILFHPVKFYNSAVGYHWTSSILFILYLGYICYYAYIRPLSGELDGEMYLIYEITLWTCNWGYILFEFCEVLEKKRQYFNFGVKGQTNRMLIIFMLILRKLH